MIFVYNFVFEIGFSTEFTKQGTAVKVKVKTITILLNYDSLACD